MLSHSTTKYITYQPQHSYWNENTADCLQPPDSRHNAKDSICELTGQLMYWLDTNFDGIIKKHATGAIVFKKNLYRQEAAVCFLITSLSLPIKLTQKM